MNARRSENESGGCSREQGRNEEEGVDAYDIRGKCEKKRIGSRRRPRGWIKVEVTSERRTKGKKS